MFGSSLHSCGHWGACGCPITSKSALLQAAEFMGCRKMTHSLVQWLQGVLNSVLTHNETARLNHLSAESLHHACPRVWHSTQVLFCLLLYTNWLMLACLWGHHCMPIDAGLPVEPPLHTHSMPKCRTAPESFSGTYIHYDNLRHRGCLFSALKHVFDSSPMEMFKRSTLWHGLRGYDRFRFQIPSMSPGQTGL